MREEILTPIFNYVVVRFSPPIAFSLLLLSAILIASPIYLTLGYYALKNRNETLVSQIKKINKKELLVVIFLIFAMIEFVYMVFILALGLPMPFFINFFTSIYDRLLLN